MSLVIIADDITGALDTGVKFSQMGINTIVVPDNGEAAPSAELFQNEVVVFDSNSRHMSPKAAYEAVYKIAQCARKNGVRYIYKKVDSGLRGNIGAEIEALSDAYGNKPVYFAPAYPAMNRVTRDGIHYIGDIPVDKSVFGQDPFNPVTSSFIPDIITQQSGLKSVLAAPDNHVSTDDRVVVVIDAATKEDMSVICGNFTEAGVPELMSGCAGFAEFLPDLLNLKRDKESAELPKSKIFILSGSVNPISLKQIAYASSQGYKDKLVPIGIKLSKDFTNLAEAASFLSEIETSSRESTVIICASKDAQDVKETQDSAFGTGMTLSDTQQTIADNMGRIAALLSESLSGHVPMIVGGDTLLSFLKIKNIAEVRPQTELSPGVVLSFYEGGAIISKSGGFSGEDVFLEVAKMISKE